MKNTICLLLTLALILAAARVDAHPCDEELRSVAIIGHYTMGDTGISAGRAIGACEATGAQYLYILSLGIIVPCADIFNGTAPSLMVLTGGIYER